MQVSHLKVNEPLPANLPALGFTDFDEQWAWVIRQDGTIVGVLLAAPCHGTAFLLRLVTIPTGPPTAPLQLLRTALREMRERGFKTFMTILCDTPEERKMTRIVTRYGANFLPFSAFLVAGKLH